MQPNTELTKLDQLEYFNNYYDIRTSFSANEVDSVIGYFLKRGFDEVAAATTAGILLQQAKTDGISAFVLIDTLRGVSNVQLSNIVAQILNLNGAKNKKIGFRVTPTTQLFEQRQILV